MDYKKLTKLLLGITVVVAGVSTLVPFAAVRAETSSADENAVRAIIQSQEEAWNKGDAKAFAAHAAEDCLFTNIVGMPFVGRRDFEERHAHIFKTIYAGSHLAISIRTLKFVTPDVAIVESELALTGYKSLPSGIQADADHTLYTELEEVFAKRVGGWQMVAFHNVDRRPSPTPSPAP